MTGLVARRCLRHHQREAVALCPQCGHYFCRECISEHQGRILCSRCLNTFAVDAPRSRRWAGRFGDLLGAVSGLMFLWMAFYYFGRLLLAIPSSFHEGTFWSNF